MTTFEPIDSSGLTTDHPPSPSPTTARARTPSALGNLLRSRRWSLGLSLAEVAAAAGCAKSYLSMVETGVRGHDGELNTHLLARLERVLSLDPGVLVSTAQWAATPAPVRRRVKELEESQRAAAAALRSTLDATSEALRQLAPDAAPAKPDRSARPGSLDEAYRSGRLHALVERLEGGPAKPPLCEHADEKPAGKPGAVAAFPLPVQVPLINAVAAGYPREFTDLGYPARVADEYVRVPDVCDPDAFAARVVGDSMTPDYREGDIIVFSPARELKSGMDCFVRLERDSETTFKRVFIEDEDAPGAGEHLRLVALNATYGERRFHREEIAGIYPAVSVTRPIG